MEAGEARIHALQLAAGLAFRQELLEGILLLDHATLVLTQVQLLSLPSPLHGIAEAPGQVQVHSTVLRQSFQDVGADNPVVQDEAKEAVSMAGHANGDHGLSNQGDDLLLTVLVIFIVPPLAISPGRGLLLLGLGNFSTRGNTVELARRVQGAAVLVLDVLQVEDEAKLGDNVQHCPSQLDDMGVLDETDTLRAHDEPEREREPSEDRDDRELPVVRVSMEQPLVAVAVFDDLLDVVEGVGTPKHEAECKPGPLHTTFAEHRCHSAKQVASGQEWHHELSVSRDAGSAQNDQDQLHHRTGQQPFHRTRQVQREVRAPREVEVIDAGHLEDVEEAGEQAHRN
mmetsp:Transcript_52004/g.116700  ORF Transcript_52004/g.116700 Transcript_52004/m.116700 type:complete len:341 (+) Transcript_52004:1484-2506(+)